MSQSEIEKYQRLVSKGFIERLVFSTTVENFNQGTLTRIETLKNDVKKYFTNIEIFNDIMICTPE